jgi:hypothetical protein
MGSNQSPFVEQRKPKANSYERHHQPAVPGVQEPELLNGQEQAQDHRAPRDEQVLSFLPQAHAAQGNEVSFAVAALSVASGHWSGERAEGQ